MSAVGFAVVHAFSPLGKVAGGDASYSDNLFAFQFFFETLDNVGVTERAGNVVKLALRRSVSSVFKILLKRGDRFFYKKVFAFYLD